MKIFAYALREYDELKYFKEICEEYGIDGDCTSDYPSLENACLAEGHECVSIITNPMNPELLDKFYSLGVRYISTRSIGYEHIDVAYANKIGMKISNITYEPGGVADYTIMLMLMACRNMQYIMDRARLQDYSLKGKIGKELNQCTVGIIGTGKIGEAVIRELQGFGCRILAYDVYQKESVRAIAEYTDLNTIYRESDIISLHVPGSQFNYHMISANEIGKMKDGVIIVIAARGLVVDTSALIDALKSGKVGYAALDTFEHEAGLYYLNLEGEPLTHPDLALLRTMPNVLLSPHMAFYTEQAVRNMVRYSILGLMKFSAGEENPFEVH